MKNVYKRLNNKEKRIVKEFIKTKEFEQNPKRYFNKEFSKERLELTPSKFLERLYDYMTETIYNELERIDARLRKIVNSGNNVYYKLEKEALNNREEFLLKQLNTIIELKKEV